MLLFVILVKHWPTVPTGWGLCVLLHLKTIQLSFLNSQCGGTAKEEVVQTPREVVIA